MDAQALCTRVRRELADVEQCIKGNSWLAEMEAGRLSVGGLRAFAGEQLQIVPSDQYNFEMLGSRSGRHHPGGQVAAGLRVGLLGQPAPLDAPGVRQAEPRGGLVMGRPSGCTIIPVRVSCNGGTQEGSVI
jgi:hypothetical protein